MLSMGLFIAERLNVPARDVRAFAPHLLRGMIRLDRQLADSDDTVGGLIPGNATPPDAAAEENLDGETVRRALYRLDRRERFVIEQRFLRDPQPRRDDGGAILGITRERVRQIENEALKKLRKALS